MQRHVQDKRELVQDHLSNLKTYITPEFVCSVQATKYIQHEY